nr:uncharacterized protein LOC111415869 [Onthophagus taurus]
MFNLRRLETISLPSKAENAYSLDISGTGSIAIATSSCLVIYQIIPNKECTLKGLCCKKYLIQPSGYVLKESLGINIEEFLFDLPQQKYNECILNAELTPDLEIVQRYVSRFVKCFWSPPHCDKNYDCVLATITNNGIVEVYVKHCLDNYYYEYKLIYNVTKLYIDILRSKWGDVKNKSATQKLNELMCRVNQVKVKCLTWSKKFDGYFLLILGHLSGKITFWKLYLGDSLEVKIEYFFEYKTDFKEINCLTVDNFNKNDGLLFVGDTEGSVITLKINLSSESKIKKSNLEINKDGVKIQSINLINSNIGDFIILVKATTLIIISCDKHESYQFECNNIEILDIIILDNTVLILTKTGVVKEVVLSNTTKGIDIKWRHFYVDINNYMRSPIGMVASKNGALVFVLTKFCKPKQSKLQIDSIDLNVFGNNENKCLEKLLKNPSKNLNYMWDYLELYRCSVLQTKIPHLDTFQQQNYDKYDLYTLKLLFFISKICDSVAENLKEILPIKSHKEIASILQLKLMLIRAQYLLNLQKTSQLSKFYLQNLLILSNYIKQVIMEENKSLDLSDSTVNVMVDVIQKVKVTNFDNLNSNCVTCGEILDDITCMPPHFDTRCCVSLMQIDGVVNFKCSVCKSVVHNEISNEMKVVVCPFCDIPMLKRREDNKVD